jgi:uroporphyrinogen decarboxylase
VPVLDIPVQLDVEGLLSNLRREGTPKRTYFIELFLDAEVEDAICSRFGLADGLNPADPHIKWKQKIALYRFLGYEGIRYDIAGFEFPFPRLEAVNDTAALARSGGRRFFDEGRGCITSWREFESYPWPNAQNYDLSDLEWLERNLPDDMCIIGRCHAIFEHMTWLMGYEGLCYAIYDQPDLVDAMWQRLGELFHQTAQILVQFDRVRFFFGGEDMAFNTSTMIPARMLIEKCFPWHARNAALAHDKGKPYLMHLCGNVHEIMPALLDQVKMDGRHSFEDAIEPVTEAKKRWGSRVALLGGIDMDFLCRASEEQIRKRVRETLDICQPGGGYCLGTGNSVANYIPLDNYLTMLDEGRRYTA